jgi:uridine kinase
MTVTECSARRRDVLLVIAARVPVAAGADAVRVAADGVDGAGKSVFADQLADVLREQARPVVRASVDDFHRPRGQRYRRGRSSPSGFWLDSLDVPFDVTAARMAGRDGSNPDPDHPSMRRYVDAQRTYLKSCTPAKRADLVIDNSDWDLPALRADR